jgi:Lsr2
MAQVTKIRLVDDLDGGNADESVDFTVDNNRYQMDLSENNAARLREVLAPFIAAARRAGGSTTTRTRRSTIAARPAGAGAETAAIREWAGANGFSVSTRGRIAASVRDAYENRAAPTAALVNETPTVEAKPKRRSRKKIADPFTVE